MFPDILTMIYAKGKNGSIENTNFDDIDFLIANFLDLSTVTVYTGGINSIRRCVMGL